MLSLAATLTIIPPFQGFVNHFFQLFSIFFNRNWHLKWLMLKCNCPLVLGRVWLFCFSKCCIGGVRSHTDNPGNTLRLADFILIFDTISTSENPLREFQFFCQSFRHRWEIFSYAGVFFLFNRKFHRNFLLNEKSREWLVHSLQMIQKLFHFIHCYFHCIKKSFCFFQLLLRFLFTCNIKVIIVRFFS